MSCSVSFTGEFSSNFDLKIYDFNLYIIRFFMKKKTKIHQISKKNKSKSPDFNDKL
jgi:hypothetical protein